MMSNEFTSDKDVSDKQIILVLMIFVVCILFKIWCNCTYYFKEKPREQLDTYIGEGIFKGLYSSAGKAQSVVDIERYLQSMTEEGDRVLCLDWASFAYMMINGDICSPTTLDASEYTYNVNDPEPYYSYFRTVGRVPNKIFYIDTGRDDIVSIDNPEWKFNELINVCYRQIDEHSNEKLNIREYMLIDEIKAMQIVNR
ncbi:MAG: hypothetical protein KBT19_09640 [Lachnospiraceae bacterium]|nr:hypothetical protein [Candidatus Colinaster equi]